jgi:hypothetical protein
MYYSYVEIEYVATSYSPTRTDLALKLLIPISPQYIDRVFLYLTQKNHLEGLRLSHQHTLAVA